VSRILLVLIDTDSHAVVHFYDDPEFVGSIIIRMGGAPFEGAILKKTLGIFCAFCMSAVLFVCSAYAGQEQCSTEVKVLLSPAEIQTTVEALKGSKESSGEVYFFDTEKRDLLAQGVIIRLRRGSTRDLTVKLRSPQKKNLEDPTSGREDFKCEIDLAANEINVSYSIRNSFSGPQIPETGSEIYGALSEGQRKLLSAAQVTIDWNQVRRVADIGETDWQIRVESRSKRLTLELWEWTGGKILELSTKTGSGSGSLAYTELRQLALDKGLKLSVDQRSKTRMVLEPHATSVAH
jgi:hypothetical protein